jgi:hypothetical protein
MSKKFKKPDRGDSKDPHKFKGKNIFFLFEDFGQKDGEGPTDIIEKKIKHSEGESGQFFCKYYEKKNGEVTKISVKSGTNGGDYELITSNGEGKPEIEKMNKKNLLAELNKNKNLDFMVDYIKKTSVLEGGAKKKKKASSGTKKKTATKKGKKKASTGGAKKKKATNKKTSTGGAKKKKTTSKKTTARKKKAW